MSGECNICGQMHAEGVHSVPILGTIKTEFDMAVEKSDHQETLRHIPIDEIISFLLMNGYTVS